MMMLLVAATSACADPPDLYAAPGPVGCSDVDVVFARGTNQPPGFGRVGDAFLRALSAGLPARTVNPYPVNYPADSRQDFGLGATDATRHVTAVASVCPATRFVLGGYSQGAMAISAAIGAPVGAASEVLPATLSPRVAAVVVFGNPLGARSQSIETIPTAFRAQSKEFCGTGDAVCGGRGPLPGTHRSYPDSGATEQAAAFALQRLAT